VPVSRSEEDRSGATFRDDRGRQLTSVAVTTTFAIPAPSGLAATERRLVSLHAGVAP
jgi:hypothetical protein